MKEACLIIGFLTLELLAPGWLPPEHPSAQQLPSGDTVAHNAAISSECAYPNYAAISSEHPRAQQLPSGDTVAHNAAISGECPPWATAVIMRYSGTHCYNPLEQLKGMHLWE